MYFRQKCKVMLSFAFNLKMSEKLYHKDMDIYRQALC